MEIVLLCEHETGQAGFPPKMIAGIPAPQRFYNVRDGKLTLAGFADPILHHDAEELLQNPLYRMPTPAEQEQMTQESQRANQVQETSIPIASDTPPARSKKAGG